MTKPKEDASIGDPRYRRPRFKAPDISDEMDGPVEPSEQDPGSNITAGLRKEISKLAKHMQPGGTLSTPEAASLEDALANFTAEELLEMRYFSPEELLEGGHITLERYDEIKKERGEERFVAKESGRHMASMAEKSHQEAMGSFGRISEIFANQEGKSIDDNDNNND